MAKKHGLAGDQKRVLERAMEPGEQVVATYHVAMTMGTAVLTDRKLHYVSGLTTPKVETTGFPLTITRGKHGIMGSLTVLIGGRNLRLWATGQPGIEALLAVGNPPMRPGPAGSVPREITGWMGRHKIITGLAALMLIGAATGDPDAAKPTQTSGLTDTTPAATAQPDGPLMPNLVGDTLTQAKQAMWDLDSDYNEYDDWDLSPRDREPWDDDNWTVVTTVPAAGEPIDKDGRINLFFLRNEEWAWFQKNPTMPKVPAGRDSYNIEERIFGDVSELIEYRYAKGHAPEFASEPYRPEDRGPDIPNDPSKEPESEWGPRDALKDAYSGLTVSTLPAAGSVLRVGQLLAILVKDEPAPPPAPSETDIDVYVDNDDDDYNVPGWLCPTRFC